MKREEMRQRIAAEAEEIAANAIAFVTSSHSRLIAEGGHMKQRMREVRKLTTAYIASRSLRSANREAAKGLGNAIDNAVRDAREARLTDESCKTHADTIRRMRDGLLELLNAADSALRMDGMTGSEFRHGMQDSLLLDTLDACQDSMLLDAAEIGRKSDLRLGDTGEEPYILRRCCVMASWPERVPWLPPDWKVQRIGNRYAKSTSIRTGSVMDSDVSAIIIDEQDVLIVDTERMDPLQLVADIGSANGMPELSMLHRRLGGGRGEEISYEPHSTRFADHGIEVSGWQRAEYYWLIGMDKRSGTERGGLDSGGPLSWLPFQKNMLVKKADYYADLF